MEQENQEENKLLKRKIFLHKWNIITNIILILLVIGLGIYIYKNVELIKLFAGDICKVCMEKTNSICIPKLN